MPTLHLVTISSRRLDRQPLAGPWLEMYLERASRLMPTQILSFPAEDRFLAHVEDAARRTRPAVVLADSRGATPTSQEFATKLGQFIDAGTQSVFFAIGPADGWSAQARARADLLLSFGRMTLPHELAAVVLAEQVYRALTILGGHPYHSGH